MNKKSLFSLLVLVFVLVGVPRETHAFDVGYFRQFIGKEVRLTVQLNKDRNTEIVIYLKEVDVLNGVLFGKTNSGDTYIEADKVRLIQKKDETWHSVLNKE